MAAGFKKATVNASDVPSTQTNFPAYVDLSRVGITTLAEAQSVRVYADSGKATEWAREIVSATEMHVKVPSLTSTVEMYVDWDGVSADYAVTDTYGRNAVWSGEISVYHLQSNSTDSTGSYTGTDTSISYTTDGQIGKGAYTASGKIVTASYSLNSAFSLRSWIKPNSVSGVQVFFSTYKPANGTGGPAAVLQLVGSALNYSNYLVDTNQGSFSAGVLAMAAVTHNGTTATLYKNGASIGSGTVAHSTATAEMSLFSRNDTTSNRYAGLLDEVRIRSGVLSSDWLLTEYNNQSDEAGFWGTWSDVGSTFTPSPLMHHMAISGGLM